MGTFVGVHGGNQSDEQGVAQLKSQLFTPGVANIGVTTGWQVAQRGAGANMSVDVAAGTGLIQNPAGTYSLDAWTDATVNTTVSASNPSNPRIDAVVAYIDLSVNTTGSANDPGALKFLDVAGTPAGSPVAPTSGTIQTAVGASNPWVLLANLAIAANATQVVNANVTDKRAAIAFKGKLWGGSSNTVGHTVPNTTDDTVALLVASQALTHKTITDTTNIVGSNTLTNPYKFLVYRNAAWTDGNGALVQVVFDTKIYDTGSNYNTSTGLFTAPVAGFYQFNWVVSKSNTANTAFLATLKQLSGATPTYYGGNQAFQGATTGGATAIGGVLAQMAAGDTAQILSYGSGGAGTTGMGQFGGTYFTGCLMSIT